MTSLVTAAPLLHCRVLLWQSEGIILRIQDIRHILLNRYLDNLSEVIHVLFSTDRQTMKLQIGTILEIEEMS